MARHYYRTIHTKKSRRSNWWDFPVAAIVLVGFAYFASPYIGLTGNDPNTVKRVIDGDTIQMGDGTRVRLIGVDTPETVHPEKPVEHFGKEASVFTKRMVEGKRVRLEFDEANTLLDHKDRYGRMLAYVYTEDGKLLNAEIIKQGYGFALTRFPFARLEEFHNLQREAKRNNRGLWNPSISP